MPYLCIAFETEVYGRLAQLVQSICLTSRGSAVRIRQRPHKANKLYNLFAFFVYLLRINTTNHIISQKNYTQIKTYL